MRNIKKIIFIFILLVIGIINVNAKDTVYSINNYKDSTFKYIEKSYDLEGKIDGFVLAGNYLKTVVEIDDEKYNDYQVLIAKYDKTDKLVWKYNYGLNKEDYVDCLTYGYDNEGNLDGYIITTKKTYDINEAIDSNISTVIKLDLEGNLVFEKDIQEGVINKIIPVEENDIIVGYISIVNNESIIRYNLNFDVIYKKDFNERKISDLSFIKKDSEVCGYVIIIDNSIMTLDLNGDNQNTINSELDKYVTYHLSEDNNGFILYGITDEVKVKNSNYSYYIIYYNNELETIETIGDIPLDKEYDIKLISIKEDYLLLYKNASDNSYEVIKINNNGITNGKLKKINNDYYNFENFNIKGKTMYFIGQINCPEDEKCDYDNRTLYLVSDEDKVIEVEDNTSTGIIIGFSIFILLIILGIIIRKKRKMKK